ncbi:Ssk22p [Rhizophagus irregularis DAOM 197198w]|uniref:Ssk22p n=1 Tax=Rhizophagus irregularis (strain DAOM 197198w) TaxID=1432141 RepID=A0A015LVX8_RHIIW|nr:Ssk22p [Rhizophagus irregularis DAOM 197198w]
MFIPFNNDENECCYCKRSYSATLLFKQKYCKHCLKLYIKCTASNNIDVHITTIDNQCNNRHKPRSLDFCMQNIHEWCSNCSEILCFKQIVTNNRFHEVNNKDNYRQQKLIENEKDCKLCGKIIIKQISVNIIEFKLCLDCYKISSGWVESTLTKEVIPILYLPWWDAYNQCIACDQFLMLKSNCQKFCSNCKIIYIGCNYCLTTNIIFGITNQSQCKRCKRIEVVSININTKDDIDTYREINDVLYYIQNTVAFDSFNCKIANYLDTINENSNILNVYDYVRKIFLNSRTDQLSINEIPHTQITNFKYVAEGGFGIIYKATWLGQDVAVKRFLNSHNISKYFLNEVKSLFQCYSLEYIIEVYGISQDIETKDYMLVMKYASGGNLHNHLHKNFSDIAWNKKLHTLWKILEGLNVIHKNHFIHRDFHSGNILIAHQTWLICDLGLSLPANYSLSNNEVYGVIPYIAPEIFKGGAFSKESDIYSIGMIMWELTTGCKPFANIDHDVDLIYKIIDGKQPEITKDTPECFANLMKRCWDSDPSRRPLITEITESFNNWYHKNKYVEIFKQAEQKRLELIQLKQLGPEFSEKPHPGAIYTSRPLSSMISNLSSTRSFSIKQDNILIDDSGEYNTKEQDLDIDISESKKRNITKVLQIETSDQGKY